MNGSTQLKRFRKLLHGDGRLPDDIRSWLLAGLRRWEKSDATLEAALGIVRDRDSLRARDGCLRAAVALMDDKWSVSEQVRQIERAAKTLSTFSDDTEVDWGKRPAWWPHISMAMQEAPLPGSWRLRDFCKIPESSKNEAR